MSLRSAFGLAYPFQKEMSFLAKQLIIKCICFSLVPCEVFPDACCAFLLGNYNCGKVKSLFKFSFERIRKSCQLNNFEGWRRRITRQRHYFPLLLLCVRARVVLENRKSHAAIWWLTQHSSDIPVHPCSSPVIPWHCVSGTDHAPQECSDWWQLEMANLFARILYLFFKVLQGQINFPNKSSSKHGKMGHKSLHLLKHKCTFKAEEGENSIIKLTVGRATELQESALMEKIIWRLFFIMERPCSRSSPVWTAGAFGQSSCTVWAWYLREGFLSGSFSGNRGLVIFLVREPVCARKFSACLKGRERAGTDVSSPFHPL
ncbi:hypothetical protein EK904_000725 [Melospiza melodia maxima]|nr:hypothetical protein EK904_000725 [Melospiza melodia maxima]